MSTRGTVVIAMLAALSLGRCEEPAAEAPVRSRQKPKYARNEPRAASNNILQFSRGAVVLERSGESSLEASAIRAIDSAPLTAWLSPPYDRSEWMVVELPAMTRIEKVGASYPKEHVLWMPRSLQFESSVDGRTFAPLTEIRTSRENPRPVEAVTPVETRFIRVTMSETDGAFVGVSELVVEGLAIDEPLDRTLSGTWSINGTAAHFTQVGNLVSGVVQLTPPLLIRGGWGDQLIRFSWTRGGQFGVGLLSISSSAPVLNGILWYARANDESRGEDWFGQKKSDSSEPLDSTAVDDTLLERFGSIPLYGLLFDEHDALESTASAVTLESLAGRLRSGPPMQLLGFEHRSLTDEENLARSGKRLESLRAALIEKGVDSNRIDTLPLGNQSRPGEPVTNEEIRASSNRIMLVIK